MFCYKCGAQISENSTFCANCGTALQANGNPQPNNNPYAPAYQQQPVSYQQPMNYQQPVNPELTMKWYKFLIYFALWAGALFNGIGGFTTMTGANYGYEKDLVYRYFEGLQVLDVIMGLCLIAVAALGIYTRQRLAGYFKNGPQMVTYLYAANAILSIIYIIGLNIVVPEVVEMLDMSSTIVGIVTSAVMVFVNKAYFAKRTKFFTKG